MTKLIKKVKILLCNLNKNTSVKNYYHILGLSFESNPEQQLIEAAYKALVKLYHPDLYKGDRKSLKRKITEINEAHEILSNSLKKEQYDLKLKKFKIEKSFDFFDDEFEDKDLFNNKYIDEDWEIALLVYPELEKVKYTLSKYSQKLSFQFQFYLLETKEFDKIEKISHKFIDAFLERKFGTSFEIKTLSKILIEKGLNKNAKYLNKLIKVLGSKSEKRIIKTFFRQFPDLDELVSKEMKLHISHAVSSNYLDKNQNIIVIFLALLLVIFIFFIVQG